MTTYYVDNSSAFASDANAGTSADKPFLSLAALNGRTFQPGDVIAFKAGTTYAAAAADTGALRITSQGTAEAPITFTSYGTGEKPAIANTTTATYSDAVKLIGASHIVIDGLAFTQAPRAGVHVDAASHHVLVQNTEATNVGLGYMVAGQHNLFQNNHAHDLHMVKNTPTSVHADDDYGANGFLISGSNNEFAGNTIVNARAASYDYGHDGGGFELWGSLSNIYIHHNWVEDSDGFLETGGPQGHLMSNIRVQNNTSIDNTVFMVVHNGSGAFTGQISQMDVSQNTIVQLEPPTRTMAAVFLDAPALRSQFYFHHNIVSLVAGDSVFKQQGDYHSDNLFHLVSPATHLYNNWSMVLGAGELYGNPMFVDAAGHDFRLTAQSPVLTFGAYGQYQPETEAPANAAPTVAGPLLVEGGEGGGLMIIDLLQGASDADAGETALLAVTALAPLPPGLSLAADGRSLVVNTEHAGFNDLADGERRTLPVSYRIVDARGGFVDQTAFVTVVGANDAPTDLVASGLVVKERAGAGTTVANLSSVDPDRGDAGTFSIVSDPSGCFAIVGNKLVVAPGAALDADIASSHVITLAVTDAGGLRKERAVTVTVEDVTGAYILGSAGSDVINGTVSVAGQRTTTDENDTVNGGGGNDRIETLGGHDLMVSLSGNDTLNGGSGNDTIDAGSGNDLVLAGSGDDVIVVRASELTWDTLDAGETGESVGDTLKIEGTGALVLANFDAAKVGIEIWAGNGQGVVGTTGNDVIDLSGLVKVGALTFVDGMSGNDRLVGTAVANDLRGGSGADTITGGGGSDTVTGGGGADQLSGGAGDDRFVIVAAGDAVGDVMAGGTGTDTLAIAGTIVAQIHSFDAAASSIENLVGNGRHLYGTGNADSIDLSGLQSLSGVTYVDGGTGADTLRGTNLSAGDDLRGGGGTDTLSGGAGDDRLDGGTEADELFGDAGSDHLLGGAGDDRLWGGAGADKLNGGGGCDWFVLHGPGSGADAITDFQRGYDKVAIRGSDYGLAAGGLAAGAFAANAAGAATGTVGQFVYNTTTRTLLWDGNGAAEGGATAVATFATTVALQASDLIVI
ncbi:MAG TPA: right-handed parallel beta-helix repeat-containing protein [Microvirga sp.]|jgi:Ca2+-binding RTX toxin-like protein